MCGLIDNMKETVGNNKKNNKNNSKGAADGDGEDEEGEARAEPAASVADNSSLGGEGGGTDSGPGPGHGVGQGPHVKLSGASSGQRKSVAAVSRSQKAGLEFPVSRVARYLKAGRYAKRVGSGAPVYLAAVLEYLAAEVNT